MLICFPSRLPSSDAETLEAIENAKPDGAQSAYIWELDEIEGDSEGQGLLLDAEEEGKSLCCLRSTTRREEPMER